MQIPQIRLQSTFAQIGLKTNNATLSIEQHPANLSIEQPKADMKITTEPSRLSIDQTKAREDVDLKSIFKRVEEAASLGYNSFLEGVARRSSEGDQLMMIENGGNAIALIAEQNGRSKEYDFNIGWVPSAGSVKIQFTPAKVNIDVQQKKPIIQVQTNKPNMNYSPGNVEVSLTNKNNLDIDFANLKHVGINYEQYI
ncbi:DUF6470 family protein [Bacillus sp. DJP31]|uniref:DUF6470 family protein n=1 Tax=Bacillus sp. DJP31 TaxID=3409789 RepID=UPI003BB4AD3C